MFRDVTGAKMGAERKEASTLLPEALNRNRGRNTGSIPQGTHAGAGDDARPGAHDDPGWADLLVDVANHSTKTSGVLARQFALDPDRLARRRFVGRVGDGDRANHQAGDDQAPG